MAKKNFGAPKPEKGLNHHPIKKLSPLWNGLKSYHGEQNQGYHVKEHCSMSSVFLGLCIFLIQMTSSSFPTDFFGEHVLGRQGGEYFLKEVCLCFVKMLHLLKAAVATKSKQGHEE